VPRPRASFDTLRALGGVFLKRALTPVFLMAVIILVAAYALMLMLTMSFSNWWLLMLILLLPLTAVLFGITLVLRYVLRRILPRKLTAQERHQLEAFSDKLFSVAERGRTPYFILVFLVAKDVIRGRESAFLRSLIGDSRELMKDFASLQRLFERN
jgi:hypothetical protein